MSRSGARSLAATLVSLAVVYALILVTGGPAASPIYALLFLMAALVASVCSLRIAVTSAVVMVGAEVALFLLGHQSASHLAAHLGFVMLFAALFATLLRNQVQTLEKEKNEAIDQALQRVQQDARDFRLIGSSVATARSRVEIEQARQVGSVRAIRDSMVDVLEAARVAVDADDAIIFMIDDAGRLVLKECVAKEEPAVIDKPSGEGAIGAVIKTQRAVYLRPRSGGRGLGYRVRRGVQSFLGVPIRSQGAVCGVLAVDREEDRPFDDKDEAVLTAITKEVERAMESERIFTEMDKLKYEQERFYEAFSLLNEALTVDLFADALMEAVTRIKPVDFVAVTLFDEAEKQHTIVAAKGAELAGTSFKNKGGGLVVSALKNGHALPYVPLSAQTAPKLVLFAPGVDVPALRSVKVFPLIDRQQSLGALVVGSTKAHEDLTREEERMLETMLVHAARTLANAQMYKHMELMATTDGLTGLVNHRRFKELLGEAIARAKRFSRKVSVLMVDADHFKAVNDTYGHPVGDLVLKRIAQILQAEARRTDVVGRYGGEEFVVVLDETDVMGAVAVAERIRERIEAEVIQGDFGRVRVTASLGLAGWPDHADSMETLLEHADQALYEAKRGGRNRVEVYGGVVMAGTTSDRPEVRA